jgi:ArsR family transcriptional regulator
MSDKTARAAAEARLLELHAATCRILAHPIRLAVIEALREAERTASDLVRTVRTTPANLSQHLAAMREAGIVEARREGRFAYYRIGDPRILTAFRLMREVLLRRLARDAGLAHRAGWLAEPATTRRTPRR